MECERWDGYIGYKIERRGKQTVGGCWYKTRREADAAADALNSDPTRNPDHDNVIDLEGRRRKLEFERLLGTVDIDEFDPIDPEEDSVQHVLDAVDYYCEVRKPPRVRNPLNVPDNVLDPLIYLAAKNDVKGRVDVWPSAYASSQHFKSTKGGVVDMPTPPENKSGRISYGDYYFLPDGSGGYDMYFQDEVVASGIESVAEARREVIGTVSRVMMGQLMSYKEIYATILRRNGRAPSAVRRGHLSTRSVRVCLGHRARCHRSRRHPRGLVRGREKRIPTLAQKYNKALKRLEKGKIDEAQFQDEVRDAEDEFISYTGVYIPEGSKFVTDLSDGYYMVQATPNLPQTQADKDKFKDEVQYLAGKVDDNETNEMEMHPDDREDVVIL